MPRDESLFVNIRDSDSDLQDIVPTLALLDEQKQEIIPKIRKKTAMKQYIPVQNILTKNSFDFCNHQIIFIQGKAKTTILSLDDLFKQRVE